MPIYPYDLHIHSCLSPCADDEMTPGNLAGLCALLGLRIVALTDHNTCKNCAAFLHACAVMEQETGQTILALPGMELTTAEEVHCVCLFGTLADAMAFDAQVERLLPPVPNRVDIFGKQQLMDENDQIVGEYPNLLINAAALPISSVCTAVSKCHGVVFPAHIEKPAYSVTANLGFFPEDCGFSCYEMADLTKREQLLATNPCLSQMTGLSSSDAHNLEKLGCKGQSIELETFTAACLFDHLGPKKGCESG